MTDNKERAASAARKIKAMQAQIAELTEAIDNLKAKEVEYFEGTLGEHIVGDPDTGYLKVSIYQSKTYNEAYGKKNHPKLWDKHAKAVRVLTSAAAKAAMDADDYAKFQKPSADLSVKVEVISE